MHIKLDRDSKVPLYRQIIEQFRAWIKSGDLPPGASVPSIRRMASTLGIGQITVRQAYDELIGHGLFISRKGSGTFVADKPVGMLHDLRHGEAQVQLADIPPMAWQPYMFDGDFFAMPKARSANQVIDLGRAQPDPGLFPFDRIKQVVRDMLWEPKQLFFDRGHAQGYQPLVEWLEHEMTLCGIDMRPGVNEIILTGGFQRGLSLVLDLLRVHDDVVAVESPTYAGILNLLTAKGIRFEPVPMDRGGMDTEYLAQLLAKERIKAIITVPTFHNPTGTVLTNERRQHLMNLSVKHRVPIIEDDWGHSLRYQGTAVPPLKALDTGGYVIHLGSFSKTFMPGLRIGWITVPGQIAVTLLRAKLAADHGDSWFLQVLLHEFIQKGHFEKHLRKALKTYKQRRKVMLAALREYMPAGVGFQEPSGGLSVWVNLPVKIQSVPLLKLCREAGADFAPAPLFTPGRRDSSAMRLSFSRNNEQDIDRGVRIISEVVSEVLENPEKLSQLSGSYQDIR